MLICVIGFRVVDGRGEDKDSRWRTITLIRDSLNEDRHM